jgi:GntR family transcriptional regulator
LSQAGQHQQRPTSTFLTSTTTNVGMRLRYRAMDQTSDPAESPPAWTLPPSASASPIPLYYQIANVLQSRIYSGDYAPGTRLGTEQELAREFRVSRTTVQKALDALYAEGIIDRLRARGTFVAEGVRPQAPVELHGFLDDVIVRGESGRTLSTDYDVVAAPAAVAQRLALPPGQPIARVRRLRSSRPDGAATAWVISYLPTDIADGLDLDQLHRTSVIQLLDRLPGVVLAHGHQVISAELADAETASRLGIAVGSPLLLVERVLQTDAGRPIEFSQFHSHGRLQSVRLSRVRRRPLVGQPAPDGAPAPGAGS